MSSRQGEQQGTKAPIEGKEQSKEDKVLSGKSNKVLLTPELDENAWEDVLKFVQSNPIEVNVIPKAIENSTKILQTSIEEQGKVKINADVTISDNAISAEEKRLRDAGQKVIVDAELETANFEKSVKDIMNAGVDGYKQVLEETIKTEYDSFSQNLGKLKEDIASVGDITIKTTLDKEEADAGLGALETRINEFPPLQIKAELEQNSVDTLLSDIENKIPKETTLTVNVDDIQKQKDEADTKTKNAAIVELQEFIKMLQQIDEVRGDGFLGSCVPPQTVF